jgi:hypothetical protein
MKAISDHTSPAVLPVNIEFENVSLRRMAAMLRVRYGLTIHITAKCLENIRYTGTFQCGDSWEFLLTRVAEELSIKYKQLALRSFELSVSV